MYLRRIKNKQLLYVLFVFTVAIVYVVYTQMNNNQSSERHLGVESKVTHLKTLDDSKSSLNINAGKTDESPLDSKSTAQAFDNRTLAGTQAEVAKIDLWRESRGYFSKAALADYDNYDLSTLKKLADGGDLKGMMALAQFYLSDKYQGDRRMENYVQALEVAAVHGSTDALERYASYFASLKKDANHNILPYGDLIEVLAWNNVAAIRGDLGPNLIVASTYKESIAQLSSEDIVRIRERSQAIYDELLKQRKLSGLGDFDNTQSAAVAKFFGYLENYMDTKK